MKRTLAFLAVLVFTLAMAAGCAAPAAAQPAAPAAADTAAAPAAAAAGGVTYGSQPPFVGNEDEVYYFVSWNAGNSWWLGGYEGFKDAARELGVNTVCAGSVDDSIENQVQAFQQVAALQPKGIYLAVSDGSAFTKVVQEVIDSGIPVTTTDNAIPGANVIMHMGYNDPAMTKAVADHIGNTLGGTGTIAILEVVGQKNLEERKAAFLENLATFWPNLEVVASANSGHDELKGASDTAQLLLQYPDLDFIFTLNPTAAMGAATAIKEAGASTRIITMDINPNVADAIKAGTIDGAVMPDSYTFGYLSMLALYCEAHHLLAPFWVADGGKTKTSWCAPKVEVGATVATKDNIDNYYIDTVYLESRHSKGFDEGALDMTYDGLPGYWVR
jgi:ABC-type sugar transport system substrate-binding protein